MINYIVFIFKFTKQFLIAPSETFFFFRQINLKSFFRCTKIFFEIKPEVDERKNNYDLISNDSQTIKNIGSSVVTGLQDIQLKRHLLRVSQVAEVENYSRFLRK